MIERVIVVLVVVSAVVLYAYTTVFAEFLKERHIDSQSLEEIYIRPSREDRMFELFYFQCKGYPRMYLSKDETS